MSSMYTITWKQTHTTDVTRGCEAQATDQTSTHVGENVSIQIRHDHDTIRERLGVRDDVKANAVEKVLVVGNIREFFRDLAARRQKHAIRHFPVNIVRWQHRRRG
jgi:hypothetical protein